MNYICDPCFSLLKCIGLYKMLTPPGLYHYLHIILYSQIDYAARGLHLTTTILHRKLIYAHNHSIFMSQIFIGVCDACVIYIHRGKATRNL